MRLVRENGKVIHVELTRRNLIELLAADDGDSINTTTATGDFLLTVSVADGRDSPRRNDGDTTGPYARANQIRRCLDSCK